MPTNKPVPKAELEESREKKENEKLLNYCRELQRYIEDDEPIEIGDTVGPKSLYVRIISNDGHRFIVKRKWIKNSLLLNYWLTKESQTQPKGQAEVLSKQYPSLCIYYLCRFLVYKYDYETGPNLPAQGFTVPPTLVFDMLQLAHDLIV